MIFRFNKKFMLSAALTAAWAGVIFFFSAQSGKQSSGLSGRIVAWLLSIIQISPNADTIELITFCVRKCAHMTEFAVLGILVINTLRLGYNVLNRKLFLAAFALSSLYAASDELHQLYVPKRSGELRDWLIDCTGILIGLIIFKAMAYLLSAYKKTSCKSSPDSIVGR